MNCACTGREKARFLLFLLFFLSFLSIAEVVRVFVGGGEKEMLISADYKSLYSSLRDCKSRRTARRNDLRS